MTWQTKKLSVICDVFADGDWIEKKDQSREGIRLIQTGNIGTGYFKDRVEKARYISEKTFLRLNCTEILSRDCLVSRLPDPVGRACIIPITGEKMITAVDCTIIRFKNEILPQWFLYYSLSHEYQSQINKEVGGATRQRISRANLGQIEVPLPTLTKQKRIVKTLDEVFEKVAQAKQNTEKNLQNSKELFRSYLRQIFTNTEKGWETKSLKDLAQYFIGLTYSPKDVSDKGIIVLRSSNVQKDKLDFLDIVRVNKKVKEQLKVRSGDILMCSRNGSKRLVGKTARIEGISEEMTFGTFMMIVRGENNDYLYWFFKSGEFRKQISGGENTMINQITRYMLDDVIVAVPPKLEWKSIVKKLDALSIETKKLEKIYKQKLTDLEELKKSILKKAFSGELITDGPVQTVQVAVPSPYFRNQVHAAIISQVSKDGGDTTEVAVAKYDHILQEVLGLNLGYQFQTQQFGPFDAQIKKLIYSGFAIRNKWFTKRSGMIVAGNNISALLSRPSNLYRSTQSAMQELSRLGITKLSAEKIELLSTVCHSIKETKSTALDKVRAFMSKWTTDGKRTKAEKFSSEQTQKCLDFIIKGNLHLKLL